MLEQSRAFLDQFFEHRQDADDAWSFMGTFVVRGLAAFSSIAFGFVLARSLGAQGSGVFFFALTGMVTLSYLTRMGMDINLTWHASAAKHREVYSDLNSLTMISLALALALSFVLCALVWWQQPWLALSLRSTDMAWGLSIMLLALPWFSLASIFSGVLKGTGRPGRAAFLEQGGVFLVALAILIVLVFLIARLQVEYVLASFIASSFLIMVIGARWWTGEVRLQRSHLTARSTLTRGFLRSSANMGLVSLITYGMQTGNILLLGFFSDQSEVGLYAISDRLVTVQLFVLSVVIIAVLQRLSTYYSQQRYEDMQKLANRSAFVSTVGALPVALLLLLAPSWCLGLFGDEFTEATFIVRALCLGYLGPVMLGGGIYLLMLSGHEVILRNILLLSLLLLITLDLILIPRYGANGAALAIVIVYVLKHLVSIYFIKKLLGFYVVPRW